MKIGLMSDSHDHMYNIERCVDIFKSEEVSYVIHLGDFISPNAIRACRGIKLKAVFGNNDGDKYNLNFAFGAIGGELKGEFYEFEEDGLLFACYHGTEPQLKEALIMSGKYDVVLYGHTHKCRHDLIGNTIVINPGTCHGFSDDPTIMIFDTKLKEARVINL